MPDTDEPAVRQSIRLRGFDYTTPGAYFVTVCAYRRQLSFEDSAIAAVIQNTWNAIPRHFENAGVDAFVVMPNHVHGIIWIQSNRVGARHASPLHDDRDGTAAGSLGAIVGAFKSTVTRQLRQQHLWDQNPLWQRNYYDRIIRNETELNRIREYIIANPAMWNRDPDNLTRVPEPTYDEAWSWLENS